MKALILAAGEGKRMAHLTADIPKSLITFQGTDLLQYKIRVLKNAGIDDIKIVTGYLHEAIDTLGYNTVYNRLYKSTNMLYSLFLGLQDEDTDILICYGDIIFEQKVLDGLLINNNPIVVAVDEKYLDYWTMRMENPFADLESCSINEQGELLEIGNKVEDYSLIDAQYIGLIKISREVIPLLRNMWAIYIVEMGEESAHQTSITPFLNWLIFKGVTLHVEKIKNGWLEFDSVNDFHIYNDLYNTGKLSSFLDVDSLNTM
ncbi:Choline kinase [Chitinophaga sp. CF118]|uniref:phosphocholine cytidylyltransferase family protein n=1 Tax=Chitinophaga sp. CF118 TaxID=1884367 RepID=UPI0008F2F539|nr:phosphocholine cytidylyltransferase family protein [Chitinophaga sp. CF118]SFD01160.1 Choline kinase [Chitinophaga sp. CF118]